MIDVGNFVALETWANILMACLNLLGLLVVHTKQTDLTSLAGYNISKNDHEFELEILRCNYQRQWNQPVQSLD